MFNKLDHIAVAVKDIDDALLYWKDAMGLKVIVDEVVAGGSVRLLHLDGGSCQIQLVQPLVEAHPIAAWLKEHGGGLHHLCFYVDDLDQALALAVKEGMVGKTVKPHQGTEGKRAFFLTREKTADILIEVTGY